MHSLSAFELNQQFLTGKVSCKEIIENYLKRIATHDEQVGSFLTTFDEKALEQAQKLDLKKSRGESLGKLAGIPIAIKDNIHVLGEITTCGSKFLTNYKAPFEATAVTLLLKEDAIIIGKTNLDEFAMGSSTENSALKKTKNPWNLNCTPGGSSGGSAACVSARFSPIALGSDTGGSIRQPASLCGIVGFKPTYGRVSRYGLVAYGSSLDQIGPFATNTRDIGMIMEVIGKHCNRDSTSLSIEPEDFTSNLPKDLKGAKIGVPFGFLDKLQKEPKALFTKSLDVLKSLGAQIIEIEFDLFNYATACYYILATAEASTNLARFDGIRFGRRSKKAKSLEEVYNFSKEEGFGEEVKRRILLGTFVLSAGYQDAYYKKAQKIRTLMINHFHDIFTQCDIVAMPTTPNEAFEIGSIQDPIQMYLQDIYTIPSNLVGLPAISIPYALTQKGLPLGLQLIGPQKEDVKVVHFAHAFEKAIEQKLSIMRKPPL